MSYYRFAQNEIRADMPRYRTHRISLVCSCVLCVRGRMGIGGRVLASPLVSVLLYCSIGLGHVLYHVVLPLEVCTRVEYILHLSTR